MLGLAGVVAVVTIALLAIAPKKEPVRVWFVRATNEAGVKKLVFEGTNALTREVTFSAYVVPGVMRDAGFTTRHAPGPAALASPQSRIT